MEFTTSRVPFSGRVLMLGCGSVAQCTLPLLLRHVVQPRTDHGDGFRRQPRRGSEQNLTKGVTLRQDRVEQHNMGEVLVEYVSDGDILINLAWNIDCRRDPAVVP